MPLLRCWDSLIAQWLADATVQFRGASFSRLAVFWRIGLLCPMTATAECFGDQEHTGSQPRIRFEARVGVVVLSQDVRSDAS